MGVCVAVGSGIGVLVAVGSGVGVAVAAAVGVAEGVGVASGAEVGVLVGVGVAVALAPQPLRNTATSMSALSAIVTSVIMRAMCAGLWSVDALSVENVCAAELLCRFIGPCLSPVRSVDCLCRDSPGTGAYKRVGDLSSALSEVRLWMRGLIPR